MTPAETSRTLAGERPGLLLAAAALFAAVVLVFAEVRHFGFLDYDDGDYVFRNPHLLQGSLAERARWSFTTFHAANWHPLTWLSFMADGALFGLDPAWCHGENLLLHALNAVLVLGALTRLTGSVAASALVAALFALHPLRVESVAWVTERKGLLMAFFSLLALHGHISYARRPSIGRYLAVVGLCVGAMLAKPQAIALPLVLLVADWWPLGRLAKSAPATASAAAREKAPLLLIALVTTALTIAAQRQAGALAPLEALTPGERAAGAAVAPVAYLWEMLWPAGLSPVYPLASHPAWQVAAAVLVIAGASAVAVRARWTQPWLAAGWLGFLALLAPVSGFLQAGGQSLADRYTYLPHVPLLVAAAWTLRRALPSGARALTIAATAGLLLVILSGLAARRQTGRWRDEVTLFTHAIAVTRGNWKAHYNLGNALEKRGRVPEAEAQYVLALAARPDFPEALNNLGVLNGRRGDAELAASLFSRAVSARPSYGPGWFNLGFQSEQAGNLEAALRQYGRAAALQPDGAEPHVRLGRVLARLGRRDEAIASCREALRLDPRSAGASACLSEAGAAPAAREQP